MSVVDHPRLSPPPAAGGTPSPAPRPGHHRPKGRRSWSAWVLLLLVVAGAGYGGYRLVDHRLDEAAQLGLDRVTLVADPVTVGSPDAAVVRTVAVTPGEAVREGARLADIELSLGGGQTRTLELTAPVDGNVVGIEAQPGSVVRAGEAVVTLYDPGTLTFQTDLPVDQVEDLGTGMTALISGPGLDEPVTAVVDRVVPVIGGAATGTTSMTVVLVPVERSTVEHLVPGVPLTGSLDTASPATGGPVLGRGE